MKQFFSIIFIILFNPNFTGQNLHLKITSSNSSEQKVIDSIYKERIFKNYLSLSSELTKTTSVLKKIGFIDLTHSTPTQKNDSTYSVLLNLGKRYTYVHLYIKPHKTLLNQNKDTLKIKYSQFEHEITQLLKIIETKGYSLSQIKATDFKTKSNQLYSNLHISKEIPRKINNINIKNYPNFPKNHLTILRKTFTKKTFNTETFANITKEINQYPFCKTTKPAEILFTKDSTTIYYFLEKQKSNTFDGYIGFNNTNNQFKINGYLDLKLTNLLNSGEKFNVYWKNDENKQKTIESNIELPYLFKSKLALKGNLNIYRQDSLFQRTKTEIELGYYLNYNHRLYLGYQETESSSFQKNTLLLLSDFTNHFYTLSYLYTKKNSYDLLYPNKTQVLFKMGYGTRTDDIQKQKQTLLNLLIEHHFKINNQHALNMKNQNFNLISDHYLTNELFRFGGFNSIRGFRENSLQANYLSTLQTEYSYTINTGFTIHTVADFAHFKDSNQTQSNQIYSLGLGLYFLSKKSLINLLYAIPKNNQQDFNLKNGLFQIKTKFLL